jgi:hypothetical protein
MYRGDTNLGYDTIRLEHHERPANDTRGSFFPKCVELSQIVKIFFRRFLPILLVEEK